MGTLYLVSVPIGNLEDITMRALRILREADIIAAEDTRRLGILLSRHGVEAKRVVSFHDRNEHAMTPRLMGLLREGKSIALCPEAGTPGISDPAFLLVREAVLEGILVVPVPGPSAVLAGLVASGLPSDRFHFAGFLPKGKGQRRSALKSLSERKETVVCFESPHRIADTLDIAAEVLPEHRLVIARELTKLHEELLRGTVAELAKSTAGREWRGELVLLLSP